MPTAQIQRLATSTATRFLGKHRRRVNERNRDFSHSDRNAKANFAPVDSSSLLEKLAELPISTWNYRSQSNSIRHLGPTAQDFQAAFGLGEDDKHISNVDSEGVALAALQALYKQSLEKDQKIAELIQSLNEKARDLEELRRRLATLEALVNAKH